jgi:polyhydroxybutyrate depolymerase
MPKRSSLVFLLMLLLISAGAQQNIDALLSVNGISREYTIHLPPASNEKASVPLVLVFHGGGGNNKQVQRYMQMDPIADRENFIVVYPNGIGKQWNDGREFKESVSINDDVQFISQLLDSMLQHFHVDSKRIFATGISNGGFFSIYLSLRLNKRLLAVAPVCASIPARIYSWFFPEKPISILIINGTKDPLVPYNGGTVGNRMTGDRGDCMPTDSMISRYVRINQTTTSPVIISLPDNNKRDGCTAIEYTYAGGMDGTIVRLVKINNGGHTLPGGYPYLPKMIIGRVCNDFEGNQMIWEFFKTCVPRKS